MKQISTLIIILFTAFGATAQTTLYEDNFNTFDADNFSVTFCEAADGAYSFAQGLGNLEVSVSCHDMWILGRIWLHDDNGHITLPISPAETEISIEMNLASGMDSVAVLFTIFDTSGSYLANEVTPLQTVHSGSTTTLTFTPSNLGGVCPTTQVIDSNQIAGFGFMLNPNWFHGTETTTTGWTVDTCYHGTIEINSVSITGPEVGVGVNELVVDNDLIEVFPNPAKDQLSIDLLELAGAQDVTLFDMYGNAVISENMREHTTLNIADVPAGSYFVQVVADNRVARKKVVIQ